MKKHSSVPSGARMQHGCDSFNTFMPKVRVTSKAALNSCQQLLNRNLLGLWEEKGQTSESLSPHCSKPTAHSSAFFPAGKYSAKQKAKITKMYNSPWANSHLVKKTKKLRDSTCWVRHHQPEYCQDEQREVIGDQLVYLLINFLPLQLCAKPKFLRSRTIVVLAS